MSPPAPPAPLVADPTRPLRAVLFGVQHSHAGKARAMGAHPQVDALRAYEADPAARAGPRTIPPSPACAGSTPRRSSWPTRRWWWPASRGRGALRRPRLAGRRGRQAHLVRQAGGGLAGLPAGGRERPAPGPAPPDGLHAALPRRASARSSWARSGLLGDLYAVRGHMSTSPRTPPAAAAPTPAGSPSSFASHMIDPTLTLFGVARCG